MSAVSGLGTLFVHQNLKSRLIKSLLFPLFRLAFGHSNQIVILQNLDDEDILVRWGVLNKDKVRILKGSGVNLNKFNYFEESTLYQ